MSKVFTLPTFFGNVLLNTAKAIKPLLFIAIFCFTGWNSAWGQAQTSTFSTAGTTAWLCPAGVTSITVKCYGGGGGGGRRTSNGVTGGGGGGAYASKINVPVTPGTIYTVVVGAAGAGANPATAGGDSYFNTASTVMAKGGSAVANNSVTGAAGGQAAACVGDVGSVFSGGTGGTGSGTNAGKGGGGAGTGGAGGNGGTGSTNGAGTAVGGGNGGNGRTATQGAGSSGSTYGGGGGGAYRNGTSYNGGAGAAGAVIIEWTGAAYVAPSSVNMTTLGNTTSTTLTEDVYFYDNGGSAADYNGSPGTTIHTFIPKSCCRIEVQWVSYALENCACDYLTIFNGNSVSAPPLGTWANSNPGTQISTADDGSLTFRLVTDDNTAAAGWYAILRNVPITSGPAQPSSIVGTLDPEVGATETYSVTNVSGVSYAWSFPSGWVVNSGAGTNSVSVTVGSTNGTISVTPSQCSLNGTARTATTTIPNYRWKYVSSSLGSLVWTGGESRNIDITIKNTGVATWNSTYTNNIGVRWNSTTGSLSGTPWSDYHVRSSVGSLAPGAQGTFTLAMQARNSDNAPSPSFTTNLADGTYYLAFDLVSEGQCWFNNNSGTCGPGNTVFYSAAQTISSTPTISTVGTLSQFASCVNTASSEQSFSVSAVNLSANLVLTAPAGYEVSTTSGSGFGSSVSLTPSSGTVASTTIYARMAAAGSSPASGNISCTSTGATTKNVAVSGTQTATTTDRGTVSPSTTQTICSGQSIAFTGGGSPAVNFGSVQYIWYLGHDIDGVGTDWVDWQQIGTSASLSAYNPRTLPIFANSSKFYFVRRVVSSCGTQGFPDYASQDHYIEVNVIPSPTANAGSDVSICSAQTVALSGSTNATSTSSNNSATYSAGDAGTLYSSTTPTTSTNSSCPIPLSVTIPVGAVITGVNVSYSMTAASSAWRSEQRAYLKCTNTGGVSESAVTAGTQNSSGTSNFTRSNLTIANSVSGGGTINFELHAFQVYAGSGCATTYSKVNNNSFIITVNYTLNPTYSWSPATGLSATNVLNPNCSATTTTTYTLTVTGTNGCSASDQVLATVAGAAPSTPTASVSGSSIINVGGTAT